MVPGTVNTVEWVRPRFVRGTRARRYELHPRDDRFALSGPLPLLRELISKPSASVPIAAFVYGALLSLLRWHRHSTPALQQVRRRFDNRSHIRYAKDLLVLRGGFATLSLAPFVSGVSAGASGIDGFR